MLQTVLGILSISLCASLSLAQETSSTASTAPATSSVQAPPTTETKVLKKIVITGSYIRRTVDEGAPSPVTQIDASSKAQEATSYSAGGVMRDNAVISSGGSSNVSFHGQSSANNLVLLNGLRLPKPGGGDTADIDFIPASAIERVEVLKDGASALYGSEALAGVVNIITKKEYDGATIGIRHSVPELGKGSESTVAATYGKSFDSGNILASFQFRNTQPLFYRDTDYGMSDVPYRGSDVSSPGNLKQANPSGPYHAAADCPADRLDDDGVCRYDYYANGLQLGSEKNYYNALLSTGWDLGSKLRLEAGTILTHRVTEDRSTPIIMRFEDQSAGGGADYSITGAQANANNWSNFLNGNPALGAGNKYNVLYSGDEELGPKKDVITLDSAMVQMKLGQQSDIFDWDVAVGYGVSDSKTENKSGNARKDLLHQKLISGDWNPFRPIGAKDNISDAAIQTWNSNFADILNARAVASGQIIPWGDKSVYAAFGVEEQLQNYRFRADPLSLQGLPLTGSSSNQNGNRDVTSIFLELTQNPIHDLQIQLAARFDKYSDFGSTTNPKIAAAYKVTDSFMVRSSFGTGFKAPDLRSLYQGDLSRPQRLRDEVICKANGPGDPNCQNLFSTTSFGNQNLDPELGEHINFGIQIRPKKNWQVSLDHWRAEGKEALNEINLSRLTMAEHLYGAAAINNLGVTIERDPISNAIQSIRYPVKTNSGTYKTNGLDFEAKYKNQFNPLGLGSVNFMFKFDHSHTLSYGQQPFFFQPYEKQLDINWKNITSFTFSKNNHLASWRLRTFSAGDKDNSRTNPTGGYGSIPTFTEHDLHYEYYGAWNGVITFGVRNIFDLQLVNEYSRGDLGFRLPASETGLGRTFYAGYSQDF